LLIKIKGWKYTMKRSSTLLAILVFLLMILIFSCTNPSPKIINHPPSIPNNPQPLDVATGVVLNPTLSWTCTDPNGDTLTYDVYFSTDATPCLAATNLTANTYNPGTLEKNTTYYWKVVAQDNKGGTSESPV
jgi:hypothetical protein